MYVFEWGGFGGREYVERGRLSEGYGYGRERVEGRRVLDGL